MRTLDAGTKQLVSQVLEAQELSVEDPKYVYCHSTVPAMECN